MSETAAYWMLSAMIAFGVVFVVGSGVSMYFYRRFGYPTTLQSARTIRYPDDIEAINKKIEPPLHYIPTTVDWTYPDSTPFS